jgi:hypothetical protein
MHFFRNSREQERRGALRNFVVGERSLRAYLAGGNVRFLEEADANFSRLGPNDRRYEEARFLLGVTKTQLRKADDSIIILEELRARDRARKGGQDSAFERKISLQLAFAHIKKYTDEGYTAAEKELESLVEKAAMGKDQELLLQAQSIQAFLYAVMAGRSRTFEEQKPDFARKALNVGEELLATGRTSQGVRFEALNALGITWMRIAEGNWDGFGKREVSWEKSQNFYDQALAIVPNSVRVLQNMAKLRLIQVEQNFPGDNTALLTEARELVMRSLEVNDQDQYPFSELARIAVLQGDKRAALAYINIGRSKPGAVKEKEWAKLEAAAKVL